MTVGSTSKLNDRNSSSFSDQNLEKERLRKLKRTVIDSYYKSSFCEHAPEYSFGTSSRPPLYQLEGGPGPGAYKIKTTLGKLMESHINNPGYFTLKGRTKFGDPYEKAISTTSKNEPGPGQYNLTGKFSTGRNPIASTFPKASAPVNKAYWAPGPGSYEPLQSMGKQMLSTKTDAPVTIFPKAARQSETTGTSNIGPADYSPPPAACAPQIDSKKPTAPTIKLGTGFTKSSNRKPDLKEPTPGPGSYTIPGNIASHSRGTPWVNAPAASISGRNNFRSPW